MALDPEKGQPKHFEIAFKYCKQALEEKNDDPKAMVNMGLIFKHQGSIGDAMRMFKAAVDADKTCIEAIVNLGAIEFEEYSHYEEAAMMFLDALEINPSDEEALCNLALALKKTSYVDYARLAFEEAVNVSPGNSHILSNYLMFLLEQHNFP
jgi:Tfp pilus assembly protein PilF